MASLRTSSAFAAACLLPSLLLSVLALCDAPRPILLLHELANAAETPVLHDAILRVSVCATVDATTRRALQSTSHTNTEKYELAAQVTPRGLFDRDCHTSDIHIEQYEISGVSLPTFQVQISNTCTNPLCSISFVIVHCGLFHSGDTLVNPKVFRRLDPLRGTCIVNDGQQIPNADTILFRYKEIWKQLITFLSARVFCHG